MCRLVIGLRRIAVSSYRTGEIFAEHLFFSTRIFDTLMSNPSGDIFFSTPTGDLSGWLPKKPQKAHQAPTLSSVIRNQLDRYGDPFAEYLQRTKSSGITTASADLIGRRWKEKKLRFAKRLSRGEGSEPPSNVDSVLSEPRGRDRDFHDLPSHLKKCLLYTSLFPKRYELHKDALIHFWMAAGFITHYKEKSVEDVGNDYFDELLSLNLLRVSDIQLSSYCVEERVYDLVQEYDPDVCVRVEDDRRNNISEQTLHVSVVGDTVDQVTFEDVGKVIGLRSLLLLHDRRKHITRIPYDLFLKLNDLRVLDLSGTRIKELPSSVSNLEALHYLDLSETPIKRLPQAVTTLCNLQILKLRDCLDFTELPKDMKDMIYLRHLELDIIRQLTSMPPTMGTLTNLQTLSAFIVGKDYGYGIAELQYMNKLRGSLSIMKLENIVTWQDAEKAELWNKKYLHRLVLHWRMSCTATEEVLEALKPHNNLEELEIVCYGGLSFPTWLGDPSFSRISSILLHNCRNCILLPPLGQLPCLKLLGVRGMSALKAVDHHFCDSAGTSKGFPRLETLCFDGMPYLEKWTGVEKDEMPCLSKVTIVDCPELLKLPNFSHLKSLQHLEISFCSKLPLLTEEGLPDSLQRLDINDCPILEARCHKEGVDWQKIVGIPNIWIDYQHISKT